jgi:membrane protease YdiL (CAAX protease family)
MTNDSQAGHSASPARARRPAAGFAWGLVCVVLLSLAVVLVPAWVIQPFRPQGQRELAVALVLRRFAPVVTIVAMAFGLWLIWKLWSPGWRRASVVISALLLAGALWLSRTNYFEYMFRPDPTPHVLALNQAGLDPDDMVLVVRAGSESRAYPVRMMAYHHLVNDTLGGSPVLPTY